MTTTTWDAFLDEVLPHVSGCTNPVAINAIRNAAIEFCRRSWAWNSNHDTLSLTATVAELDFLPPDDQLVSEVLEAWIGEHRIYHKSPDDLTEALGHNWQTRTGLPKYITQTDPRVLRLVPIPAADMPNALSMRVSWKPTRTAAGIDTTIFEEYVEEIACGALMRLFKMPKKPWSSATLYTSHYLEFDAYVAVVKTKVQNGFGRTARRTIARFF